MRRTALLTLIAAALLAWWLWPEEGPDRAAPARAPAADDRPKSDTPAAPPRVSARVRVRAKVLDAETRQPIPDAVVEVVERDVMAEEMGLEIAEVVGRARAGADGRFEVATRADPEGIELVAHAPGYSWESAVPAPWHFHIELERTDAIVTGIVVDPTGAPVPRARLAIHSGALRPLRADADGRFEVGGFRLGNVEIVAGAPGFAAAWASVDVDTDRPPPVTLQLSRGTVLHGTVYDHVEGKPLEGVRVRASTWPGPAAFTGPDGRYELAGVDLTDGGERVEFALTRYRRDVVTLELDAPDWERARLDAFLAPGAVLTGTVVDPDGRPVPDAVVVPTNLDVIAHTHTGGQGRFTIDHLTPDYGTNVLYIVGGGYLETHTDELEYGEVGEIELVPDGGARVTVSGVVRPPKATVHATVPVRQGRAVLAWTRCKPDGRFALKVPPDRRVRLEARADGQRSAREVDVPASDFSLGEPLVVPPAESGLVFRLAKAKWAALLMRDADGWSYMSHFRSETKLAARSTACQFVAVGKGFTSGVRSVAAGPGEVALPVLPGKGRLEVTVRTPGGQPVAGVRAVVVPGAKDYPVLAEDVTGDDGTVTLAGFAVVEELAHRLALVDDVQRPRSVTPFRSGAPRLDVTWREVRALVVHVVGPDGAPLALASVHATDGFGRRRPEARVGAGNDLTHVGREDLTDAQGTVRFANLIEGPCRVRARHPAHGRVEAEVDLAEVDAVTLRFR